MTGFYNWHGLSYCHRLQNFKPFAQIPASCILKCSPIDKTDCWKRFRKSVPRYSCGAEMTHPTQQSPFAEAYSRSAAPEIRRFITVFTRGRHTELTGSKCTFKLNLFSRRADGTDRQRVFNLYFGQRTRKIVPHGSKGSTYITVVS